MFVAKKLLWFLQSLYIGSELSLLFFPNFTKVVKKYNEVKAQEVQCRALMRQQRWLQMTRSCEVGSENRIQLERVTGPSQYPVRVSPGVCVAAAHASQRLCTASLVHGTAHFPGTFQTFQLFLTFHFAFSDVDPLNQAVRDIFNKKIFIALLNMADYLIK